MQKALVLLVGVLALAVVATATRPAPSMSVGAATPVSPFALRPEDLKTGDFGCTGSVNSLPIWDASNIVFVNSTSNGSRYRAGFVDDAQPLSVVHVYGTPYEMGFAVGQLMRAEVQALVPDMFAWVFGQIQPYIKFLPAWLQTVIEVGGVDALLDITRELTLKFQPAHFDEELKGLSDGSGVDLKTLQRLAMFPEATSMACSIVGAQGAAVDASLQGKLLQLRALDWGSDAPVAKFPLLLVYHPLEGAGHPFMQLGWPGLVGAVTGASPYIFQSEKVWIQGQKLSTDPRTGIPATYLIRDILQFDESLDAALNRIETANRTCAYFLGLGERKTSNFKLVENSFQVVNEYDDQNFPGYDGHPNRAGLVYVDKHVQPSNWKCMEGLMNSTYGKLTPQVMFQQVTALAETGDQHIAVFDELNDQVFIAVTHAAPNNTTQAVPAYNRPFLRFTLSTLFDQPKP